MHLKKSLSSQLLNFKPFNFYTGSVWTQAVYGHRQCMVPFCGLMH